MTDAMVAPRDIPHPPMESPDTPRASVIMPHLNAPDVLARCLTSVLAEKIDEGTFEVIVVDNGSDMSLAPLQRAFPAVTFLTENRPGPGPARNLGVAHARADILAFIDCDVVVRPGWLQAGIDAIGQDPLSYVGGDIATATADPVRLTPIEAYQSVFDHRQKKYIRKEHYSATGNVIMTRAVFDLAGPFDGIDKPEDREFGQRVYAHGIRARYAPRMQVLHPARESFAAASKAWGRLIAQAFKVHVDSGRPLFFWHLRALAVMASAGAHVPLAVLSRRITGTGNRTRAIACLFRIRWMRGIEMLKVAANATSAGHNLSSWNR